MEYLNKTGLSRVWAKIKNKFSNAIISGSQTTTSTQDGGNNVYTFTDMSGNTSTFTTKNGSKGSPGNNGTSAYWFAGTAVTGTGSSISASVTNSKANDMYLNTSTYNVYIATATNTWKYLCNIKGANGTNATTTSVATTSANGLMSSTDKTKLNGIAEGATANTGTITGIKMNGSSKGTSGVVDLGTVLTSHQDISGKVDKVNGKGLSTNDFTTTLKNKLDGIASGAEVNTMTGVKGSSESSYRTGNVSISKDNIGLGNVDNKSSATIRGEITSSNVTSALGYTPLSGTTGRYSGSLNSISTTGFFIGVPCSDYPSGAGNGYGFIVSVSYNSDGFLMYFDKATNTAFYRVKNSGSWGSWKKITST